MNVRWCFLSFLFFFFLVGEKLVKQHEIAPIVWAWLSQPTKNLPGFQTHLSSLPGWGQKGMLPFLLYLEQVCCTGRTFVLLYLLWSFGHWLFLVFVFRLFILHAVSFSSIQRIRPTELPTHIKGALQVTSSEWPDWGVPFLSDHCYNNSSEHTTTPTIY